MSAPNWVTNLEVKAAHALTGKLESWPSGEYVCPWLRWYFSEPRKHRPKIVFILQDWGLFCANEHLADAIQTIASGSNGDRTTQTIAKTAGLQKQLNSGAACIMNAIWGLRNSGSKTKPLSLSIHRAAFPIWATALLQFKPEIVCLCGAWAKDPQIEWNRRLDGAQAMELWIRWAELENKPAVEAENFKGMQFQYFRHPSAVGSDFAQVASELTQ